MTDILIDGKKVKARKGEFLLAVARREGIDIPTLCHHEAVEPSGACRLCMVEITKDGWDGWSKLVTSCLFPVEEGLKVSTNSDRVRRCRREILELLLARSPGAEVVRELAAAYGIESPRYKVDEEGDNCILCGICTRVCQNLVTGAISRVNRGVEKRVETPFAEDSEVCIGCLACARSCPTGAIAFEEKEGTVTIWGQTFELLPCPACGEPSVTARQAAWMVAKGIPEEDSTLCVKCKGEKTAGAYRKIMW
jgi:bidirectional [NiFe] hydrogenase diaphorase subunit